MPDDTEGKVENN